MYIYIRPYIYREREKYKYKYKYIVRSIVNWRPREATGGLLKTTADHRGQFLRIDFGHAHEI